MHDLALDFSADRSSVLLHLSEEHVNLLDDVKSSYDIRNQRWERFCKAVTNTGKFKVYLTALISVLLTFVIMMFVFSESHYVCVCSKVNFPHFRLEKGTT